MSDVPVSDATAEWPVAQPTDRRHAIRTEPSRYRQNATGDLVIPLDRGEIVTLPRLWGFVLDVLTESRAVLRGPGGLTAEVALLRDGAVVEHVGTGAPLRTLGNAA